MTRSPPLRSLDDQAALWEAIRNGEIDSISTDHCSYNLAGQKDLGRDDFSKIPNGLPGIEHRPAAVYTAGVAAGRMGAISVGADADIVVWDPAARWTISAETQHQNCDYTPYEGMAARGRAKAVFLRGELAAENGEPVKEGLGTFVAA